MQPLSSSSDHHPDPSRRSDFIDSLSSSTRHPRAQRGEGTFGEFLKQTLPATPGGMVRPSHEYIWKMLRWPGRAADGKPTEAANPRELFRRDLFGIDEPLT